jgi:hypothetical protein
MMDMKKMNVNWECIWNVVEKVANLVTIIGIVALLLQLCDYNKILKQEQADEIIIEAKSIFEVAMDSTAYQDAYKKFLEAKEKKPNDFTGYNLFLELANRRLEYVKNENEGIYKYDIKVEQYLKMAISLNDRQNEAQNYLNQLDSLKMQ